MKRLFLFILILASGYWCYDHYGQNVPLHTSLSNVDGRSMDVVILSRSQTQVHLERQLDGVAFDYSIADLSLWSKCKVFWNFKVSVRATKLEQLAGETDSYLNGMDKGLEAMRKEMALLEVSLDAQASHAKREGVANRIEAIQLKIYKLELRRAEHLSGQ